MASERLKSASLFIGILLLGIGFASFLYFYQIFYKPECFLPGVRIASVPVEGYSIEKAAGIITEHINRSYNAPISFYSTDYTYNTKLGDLCDPIDIDKLLAEVWKQEGERSFLSKISNIDGLKVINYPVKAKYNLQSKAELLDELNKALGAEAVNARLEMDLEKGLLLIPSKSGSKVDEAATFAGLPQQCEDFESLRIPIIMKKILADVTDDDLKNMGELSAFTTWFNAKDVNRSHNLYLAAASLNGCMVHPAEIMSFNGRVGQRVSEAGYRDALVIVGGKFEPGLGGGVCQVSSTLYNAILLAGLEIIERHNHALTVAYVPVGRDATVVYDLLDLRFKNNTSHPIYIHALARGGRLSISVYGNINKKRRIELSTIIDQTIAFKESRHLDPSLQPGQEKVDHVGFPGYVARSFRSYLDAEGKLIKREKLATDYYKPLDKLILVGAEALVPPPDTLPVTEEPDKKPTEEPGEKNTEEPGKKPAEEQGKKPAEEQGKKPAEEQGKKPADQPKGSEPLNQKPETLEQLPPEVGI